MPTDRAETSDAEGKRYDPGTMKPHLRPFVISMLSIAGCARHGGEVSTVLPVWWDRDYLTEIQAASDVDAMWASWRPKGAEPDEFLTIVMTLPDDSKRECATVAEWNDARARQGYAATTFDLTMQSHFIERHLAYTSIPHLLPAKRSGFAKQEWESVARSLVTADDDCSNGARVARDASKWDLSESLVDYADEEQRASARVLARGDYDADGWQDLVVSTTYHLQHGSLRNYEARLYCCRSSGRVIDASGRLLDGRPSADDVARHRAALASSFGLPERVPIRLEGTIEGDPEPLPIEVELTFDEGFVTGTCTRRSTGEAVPIEGTLGRDGALSIEEFALDNEPSGRFVLAWRREGDKILIDGSWSESMEALDVQLSGRLPATTSG